MTQHVTLKDIAREADLSVSAVSKALSGHADASRRTRERVLAISDRLNYQPRRRAAPKPRPGRARNRVAFVLCGDQGDYRAARTELLARFAADVGLRLELCDADALTQAEDASRIANRFDAVALCGDEIYCETLRQMEPLGLPCLAFGAPIGEPTHDPSRAHILGDPTLEMGQTATQALIAAGQRRIGFVAGACPRGGWNAGWRDGYRLALLNNGLPVDPDLSPDLRGGPTAEVGTRAADHFTRIDPLPAGWLIPSASGAARFLSAMRERGVEIPADRLITSSDPSQLKDLADSGLSGCPRIDIDLEAQCRFATQLLRAMISREGVTPARHSLPFRRLHFDRLAPAEPDAGRKR